MKITRTLGLIIILVVTIMMIIMPSFILQRQALAKIFVYNRLLNIDTDKPLAPQLDQMWSKYKASLTTSQWKNFTDTWPVGLENATSRCMNMSMIFKGISFDCNTNLALVVINCQAKVLKQDVLFCSDTSISDYLKSRNVTNIEGYAKYAIEHNPKLYPLVQRK